MDIVKDLSVRASTGKRRYKFQNFQERVQNVRVDVSREVLPIHEIDARDAAAGDEVVHRHCITHEEITKLKDLDLSKDFKVFASEIEDMCLSLPLLLNNLDRVTSILANHLRLGADTVADRRKAKPSIATPSVLKIIVAVAKDTQHALLPHASALISACFGLVVSDSVLLDVGLSSNVFKAAGVVLMQVGKSLIESDPKLKCLRDHYVALFGHHRDFVRRFSAETFCPLIRKLPASALKAHVKFLVCTLVARDVGKRSNQKWQDQLTDGVAMVLCGLLRNVQNRFHSKADAYLEYIIAAVRPKSSLGSLDLAARHALLHRTMEIAAEYTRGEHCEVVWQAICGEAARSLRVMREHKLEPNIASNAACLFRIIRLWTMHRGGSRLTRFTLEGVLSVLEGAFTMSKKGSNIFCDGGPILAKGACAAILAVWFWVWKRCIRKGDETLRDALDSIELCAASAFAWRGSLSPTPSENHTDELVRFARRSFKLIKGSEKVLIPRLVAYGDALVRSEAADTEVVKILMGLGACNSPISTISDGALAAYIVDSVRADRMRDARCAASLMLLRTNKLEKDDDTLTDTLAEFILAIDAALVASTSDSAPRELLHLRSIAANAYVARCEAGDGRNDLWTSSVRVLCCHPTSVHANASAASLLKKIPVSDPDSYSECADLLVRNLSSEKHALRSSALAIMNSFPCEFSDVLKTLEEVENMPISLEWERPRSNALNGIAAKARAGSLPAGNACHATIASHLLGLYYVKFQPLWAVSTSTLKDIMGNLDKEAFDKLWESILLPHLHHVCTADSIISQHAQDTIPANLAASAAAISIENTRAEQDVASTLAASSTDAETVHGLVLSGLSTFAERKSRSVVPLFVAFLRDEYYGAAGRDDLDAPLPGTDDFEAHSQCIASSTLQPPSVNRVVSTTQLQRSWCRG